MLAEVDHPRDSMILGFPWFLGIDLMKEVNPSRAYGSNRNLTVTVTWAGTGFPFRVAGSYRYCLSAWIAAFLNAARPESAFMDFTRPEISTSASNITLSALPPAKSWRAFGEAIARTDLINFGGTIAPSDSGAAETMAALLNGGIAARFPTDATTTGFSVTDSASAAALRVDLLAAGISDATVVEGSATPRDSACGAACESALVEVVGALAVSGNLAEEVSAGF